jgi:ribonuclease VapC
VIIDPSAVLAIMLNEPERPELIAAVAGADVVRMSAASYVEIAAVVERRHNPVLSRRLDELLDSMGVELMPFDAEQATIARAAYRDFGRGSGHRAGLNLGDTFSYAAAKSCREPLLWVGNDFDHTDVTPSR